MNTETVERKQSVTINDQDITIRPLNVNDIFFQTHGINRPTTESSDTRNPGSADLLSSDELSRLFDSKNKDSMAFVATLNNAGVTSEVGVALYAKNSNTLSHEMVVNVTDEFRHTDLARELVESLILYAKEHQVATIYSIESTDNIDMRKLAEDVGMSVRLDSNNSEKVIYSINVEKHPNRVVV